MKQIVSSFKVKDVTVNLIKPENKSSIEEDKKRLAEYLHKLLKMGIKK